MIFKTIFKSKLDDLFEVTGLRILLGQPNLNNPDLDKYVPLILTARQTYIYETDDPEIDYARFSKITYKKKVVDIAVKGDGRRKYVDRAFAEVVERKNWAKYDPTRNFKWVVDFTNHTESTWVFMGDYVGRVEIKPYIPVRLALSPLSRLAEWKTIEIKYHHRRDKKTGQVFPRVAMWFGSERRSKSELAELSKDVEKTLKQYNLTPQMTPDLAANVDLVKPLRK